VKKWRHWRIADAKKLVTVANKKTFLSSNALKSQICWPPRDPRGSPVLANEILLFAGVLLVFSAVFACLAGVLGRFARQFDHAELC
jgi:hypothetical protein